VCSFEERTGFFVSAGSPQIGTGNLLPLTIKLAGSYRSIHRIISDITTEFVLNTSLSISRHG
jgi:hypothetical protein